MPQLDIISFSNQVLWLTLVFSILLPLFSHVLLESYSNLSLIRRLPLNSFKARKEFPPCFELSYNLFTTHDLPLFSYRDSSSRIKLYKNFSNTIYHQTNNSFIFTSLFKINLFDDTFYYFADQTFLLAFSCLFLIIRCYSAYVCASKYEKFQQVRAVSYLPLLLILIFSYDLVFKHNVPISLFKAFIITVLHALAEFHGKFIAHTSLAQLNAKITAHYEQYMPMQKKFGRFISAGAITLSLFGCSISSLLLQKSEFIILGVLVNVSCLAWLLFILAALAVDSICLAKAPYPSVETFRKHGIPVRFLPATQVVSKLVAACSMAAKGSLSIFGAGVAWGHFDMTYSKFSGKECPSFPIQKYVGYIAKSNNIDIPNRYLTWKECGEVHNISYGLSPKPEFGFKITPPKSK